MCYKSDNAVLNESMIWDIDTKSLITCAYKLFEKFFALKPGMGTSAIGYNSDEYEQFEKICSMAYTSIKSLKKDYVKADTALNEIEKLKDNWNNNGANSFSAKLIERCREIVKQLVAEPFICPTACGSIQFEYEKENGDYLEFEIYEDRIEVFLDIMSGVEEEFDLQGSSAIDKMKQMVVDFYG